MKKTVIFLFIILIGSNIIAQDKTIPIDIGYFAPYLIHVGGKIGTSFELKNWKPDNELDSQKTHSLSISPQIGYFVNPDVQKNLLINSELVYKRKKSISKMYLTSSIGLGYMLGIQNQGGTVSLAKGTIERETKAINYLVPTLSIGFAKDPQKIVGYYLKGFYGRKISSQVKDSAFFGLELGLKINLKKKK